MINNVSNQIILYISGFVVRRLQKTIKCEKCQEALIGCKENFLNSLITQKNHGGLTYPSQDVILVCKESEQVLRMFDKHLNKKYIIKILKNKIMFNFIDSNIFDKLKHHVLENTENHIYFLIQSIIEKYLKIRMCFIAKQRSQHPTYIRNQLTKLVLFKGQ